MSEKSPKVCQNCPFLFIRAFDSEWGKAGELVCTFNSQLGETPFPHCEENDAWMEKIELIPETPEPPQIKNAWDLVDPSECKECQEHEYEDPQCPFCG
ncbi:MAG: hypothetical protein ACXQTD_09600, partial [Candidatus Syntropharchaeia archaeon]